MVAVTRLLAIRPIALQIAATLPAFSANSRDQALLNAAFGAMTGPSAHRPIGPSSALPQRNVPSLAALEGTC